MTLLILAAGLGSRYGGLKQLDPINEYGEFIIDYSVFDAKRAGFDRVVFVIKEENYEAFRETIGSRIEGHIKVEYAFQKMDDIPEWASVPEGRSKPWGTTHAVLAARDIIDDNFAVCNADDFYGCDAFQRLAGFLNDFTAQSCSVDFILKNTLSDLIVAPRDIDYVVGVASNVVSKAINLAFKL